VNQYVFERKMHKLNEEIEFVFNEERIKLPKTIFLFIKRLLAGLKHIIKPKEKKITMILIVTASEIKLKQKNKILNRIQFKIG